MEVSVRNSGIPDERAFLTATFDTGTRLARMLDFDRARLKRDSTAAPESTGI
jgi:hypothetical protein